MAKGKKKGIGPPTAPSAEEYRRWQAESMVEKAIKDTPEYRKAVNAAMRQLKQAEQTARATLRRRK